MITRPIPVVIHSHENSLAKVPLHSGLGLCQALLTQALNGSISTNHLRRTRLCKHLGTVMLKGSSQIL